MRYSYTPKYDEGRGLNIRIMRRIENSMRLVDALDPCNSAFANDSAEELMDAFNELSKWAGMGYKSLGEQVIELHWEDNLRQSIIPAQPASPVEKVVLPDREGLSCITVDIETDEIPTMRLR